MNHQTSRPGKVPLKLFFGYVNINDEGELRKLTVEDEARYTRPKVLGEEACENILKEQARYKASHDKSETPNVIFTVGVSVVMKDAVDKNGLAVIKLDNRWRRYAATAYASQ